MDEILRRRFHRAWTGRNGRHGRLPATVEQRRVFSTRHLRPGVQSLSDGLQRDGVLRPPETSGQGRRNLLLLFQRRHSLVGAKKARRWASGAIPEPRIHRPSTAPLEKETDAAVSGLLLYCYSPHWGTRAPQTPHYLASRPITFTRTNPDEPLPEPPTSAWELRMREALPK